MGYGVSGFRCLDCNAEWNLFWSSVTMHFPSTDCPNCSADRTSKLDQTVPFARDTGAPPDFIFRCICGKTFQKPPVNFNPFEQDPEKIRQQNTVACPFCKRTNDVPLGWYVP